MKFFFSVLFLCATLQGFSQLKTIDSLQQILDNTPQDAVKEQLDLNLKLASKYNSIKNKKANSYAKKAYQLAIANDSIERKHEALIAIADYKKNYEMSDTVVTVLNEVKEYANANQNQNLYLRANNSLIAFYMATRDDANALTVAQENLDIATTDEEKFYAHMGMATTYQLTRNHKKICEYASRAFQFAIALENKTMEAEVLSRLGKCNLYQRNFQVAKDYLEQTIELTEANDLDRIGAFAYLDLARMKFIEEKDTVAASKLIDKANRISKQLENERLERAIVMQISSQYGMMGEFDKAVYLLKKVYDKSLENGDIDIAMQTASRIEFEYNNHMNIADSALVWNKTFNKLQDSILSLEKQTDFKEIETKYEVKETKEENAALQGALEIKKKEQLQILIAGFIALIVLIIIGYLIYNNIKKKQQLEIQQRKLEQQAMGQRLKEQELATIDALIAGQEQERKKIASELHDNIGANLAAAKLQFKHILENKERIDELESLFEKTESLLDETYNELRALAHQKNNGVLAEDGLLPAVKKMTYNSSTASKLKVELTEFGLQERLENTFELTIYRILQELVTNVIKHANATEVNISITKHDDLINIMVEDNGNGFDASKISMSGMGLSSVKDRVRYLHGEMEIESTPGHGTNVVIDIPLQKAV